ncbi:MAG: ExeM/NucH family extracellular endonuclease, partial [Anaerolineae bacterium]|nr:ExeM/NucH family extracellular endonuclease [Anaerolineae bacterium]
MSDGSLDFGNAITSGDFARGSSTGGVTTGGVYAFDTGGGNRILGIQPGGSDFAPGDIKLRIQNTTGATVTTLDVSYTIWYYNDQGRGNSLNFAHSSDNSIYLAVGSLDFTTPAAADSSPAWQSVSRTTTLTGLNILNGDSYYLRWRGSDVSGSGSRDEYGIDDVQVSVGVVIDNPPQITSTSPVNAATNVPTNKTITLNFNEPVDLTASAVTWTCGTTVTFSGLPASDVSSVTLTPDSALPEGTTCTVTAVATQITDNDGTTDQLDGNGDNTAGDNYTFSFTTVPPLANSLIINEVDSDTPGTDAAEFVELYDGGNGNTPLDGFVLVFFNGSNDQSYGTFDLDGKTTDTNGYFVLGNAAVTHVDWVINNNSLQNGADAVALYQANGSDFPNGTAVTTNNLIDAIVYDTNDDDNTTLLTLLNPSEPQVNEDSGGNATNHANQRCPNGTGGQRNTSTYSQNTPTPGMENFCGVCEAATTPISAIQGNGLSSPMEGSTGVTIRGTVVGDFQGLSELSGFFVQDSGDGDPSTSDGIFVYHATTPVSVGQVVEVTGDIIEFNELTEMNNISAVKTCGIPPNGPTAAPLTLPVSYTTDFEPFEGMLTTFTQDLTVTEHFNLGRYGEVLLSSSGHLMNPTQVADPGAPATAVHNANLLNQILLDDGSTVQNPDPIIYPAPELSAVNTLRAGSSVTNLTGIISYGFGAYRLQPTSTPAFTPANPRTGAPPAVGGSLKLASFNVLNYFNGDGSGGGFSTSRGADTLPEFNRQRDKIIAAISALNADVVGLMEIENDGYGANSAIQDLVNGLNIAAGSTVWAFINPGSTLGSDEITVGLIYKTAQVTPYGSVATLSTGAFASRNRQPLVQTFVDGSGEKFTIAVNHFKSKSTSSNCNTAEGVFPPDPDTGDWQGNCNITRTMAAAQLADWLATDPTISGDPDFIIMGDLNSYAREDPIKTLKNKGYTNLFASFDQDSYSYVYDGEFGTLDYIMANESLTAQVTGATSWHINADEPLSLDYNLEYKSLDQQTELYAPNAYRASDHDPVIIGLELDSMIEADFSDLDAVYDIAWHTGNGGIRLGSLWTPDNSSAPNNDNASDDGVAIGPGSGSGGQWQPGINGASLTIEVTGSGTGCLYAWVDWNHDGFFDDNDADTNLEYAIRSVAVNSDTTNDYFFEVPANEFLAPGTSNTAPNQSYNVRVRLYAACASSPTGASVGGEVEDYTFTFTPTAVTLQSFNATNQNTLWLAVLL